MIKKEELIKLRTKVNNAITALRECDKTTGRTPIDVGIRRKANAHAKLQDAENEAIDVFDIEVSRE